MVEAGWAAVQHDAYWKSEFERLCQRMHQNKAIVAIARRLLVLVWKVLKERWKVQEAEEERVAKKLLEWAWKVGKEGRGAKKAGEFVKEQLDALGVGETLEGVRRGSRWYRLAEKALMETGGGDE